MSKKISTNEVDLMQEINLLKKQNKELVNQMIALVEATQKGFQIINDDLTRIAKLK